MDKQFGFIFYTVLSSYFLGERMALPVVFNFCSFSEGSLFCQSLLESFPGISIRYSTSDIIRRKRCRIRKHNKFDDEYLNYHLDNNYNHKASIIIFESRYPKLIELLEDYKIKWNYKVFQHYMKPMYDNFYNFNTAKRYFRELSELA